MADGSAPVAEPAISPMAYEIAAQIVARDGHPSEFDIVVLLARAMALRRKWSLIARETGFDVSGLRKWGLGKQRPALATRLRLLAWGIERGLITVLGDQPPLDPAELAILARIRADIDSNIPEPAQRLIRGEAVTPPEQVLIERWATAPASLGGAA